MDQGGTGYATELRFAIVQKWKETGVAESVIARFQHKPLAGNFLSAIRPITGCLLVIEELHGQ